MENFLKHKMQRRPDRQSLIAQHILEDTTVSPSLQDKQRQLKRARLTDGLNDRLSQRPGPLELVKGNILIAEEGLAQAIKEGALQFKATSEGEPVKHPPPLFHLEDPESSISSSDGSPPQDLSDASVTSYSPLPVPSVTTVITTSTGSSSTTVPTASSLVLTATTVTSLSSSNSTTRVTTQQPQQPQLQQQRQQQQQQQQQQPQFIQSIQPICVNASNLCPGQSGNQASTVRVASQSSLGVLTSTASNSTVPFVLASSTSDTASTVKPATHGATIPAVTVSSSNNTKSEAISKARKKSKSKVQPKARAIKFHEYKVRQCCRRKRDISLLVTNTLINIFVFAWHRDPQMLRRVKTIRPMRAQKVLMSWCSNNSSYSFSGN